MGDGDRFKMELEASSLRPARRRLWCDGRWGLGLERQTPPAASRVTEQPYLGSTLLTSHEEGPRKGGLNIARSLLPERVTAPVGHLFPAVENFAHLPTSLSDLQPGTFELFWTTMLLIDLHDVLPSFPLSSADTMSTLPHCLKLVWLMKDL